MLNQNNIIFCNNCGNKGHTFHNCKYPITSIGIILYKYDEEINDYKFLMIRRRNTLGFVDFMRGRYTLYNKSYILNILNEMTKNEKKLIMTKDFDTLWNILWGSTITLKYRNEEKVSREKFALLKMGIDTESDSYNLEDLVKQSNTEWDEEEWGFPKGRRNYQEKDIITAIREFCEETGIKQDNIELIQNIIPYDEIFTGSNFKSYKHKYYVAYLKYDDCDLSKYQRTEVSKVEWKTYKECLDIIRPYNKEKKRILGMLYETLHSYKLSY